MELTNEPLEWNSDDTAAFRVFLGTRAGSRLIPKLVESAPALLAAGDINAILVRNGARIGFEQAARELLLLAYPPPAPPQTEATNYPRLDDDKAWDDKQKLE